MATLSDTFHPSAASALSREGGEVRDYLALLKPRVMSLVIFTALVGMLVPHASPNPVLAASSLLMIAIGAGASGCLNMWWDADVDALMTRTRTRPIPAGRIEGGEALAFGLTLSVGSVLALGLIANWLAAALLAFTIVFYVLVYSVGLKRATDQNIVIGGLAGALPPVVADAAVTGTVGIPSLVLCAIIFLWTPPHFWALALVKSGEYGRAGIPMMPNVRGPDVTRNHILGYTLILVPFALLPVPLGFGGLIYAVVSMLSGAAMLAMTYVVFTRREGDGAREAAMRLFGLSILYLLLLFASLLVEHGLGQFRPVPGLI